MGSYMTLYEYIINRQYDSAFDSYLYTFLNLTPLQPATQATGKAPERKLPPFFHGPEGLALVALFGMLNQIWTT